MEMTMSYRLSSLLTDIEANVNALHCRIFRLNPRAFVAN